MTVLLVNIFLGAVLLSLWSGTMWVNSIFGDNTKGQVFLQKISAHTIEFLFLYKTESNESGPWAQCMAITSRALIKSDAGKKGISQLKKLLRSSIFKVVIGSVNTDVQLLNYFPYLLIIIYYVSSSVHDGLMVLVVLALNFAWKEKYFVLMQIVYTPPQIHQNILRAVIHALVS